MKKFGFLAFILMLFLGSCTLKTSNKMDLSGAWKVKLDSLDVGTTENWAKAEIDGQVINLPGTLDDAEIGTKSTLEPGMNNYVLSGLTRKHQYIGAAWYQKEIIIPKNWTDKQIELKLERIIWESQVFVDGNLVGKKESLIAPHVYNLSEKLTPGKHLLSIRIDNSNLYPLINVKGNKYPDPINQDMAHAYTNHTQIKWNGITGEISLNARGNGGVDNVQVFPNLEEGSIKATFENASKVNELRYQLCELNGEVLTEGAVDVTANEVVIEKPEGLVEWDEFNPNLYDFKIIASFEDNSDTTSVRFGYNQVTQNDGTLLLNGKRIYLRGNLECSIFPLTGRPPMQKEGWAELISQAKAYGLNHLRFHSWCPPKAAFEAADEAGFYYQVELPHWSLRFGEDEKTTQFLLNEAELLFKEYGNHPSLILMALGNELQGDIDLMNSTVAALKAKDPRHLYMTTCYSFQYPLGVIAQPEDDYFVTQKTDKGWIRGQGIFNAQAPNFNEDFTANSEHVPVPLISHEIGQYSVYPDMSEIEKYTGVLKPLNFISIKNEMEEKGLLQLSKQFTMASGKLAAVLYKEEIERALKTPSFDGFQLLQLQDFPGQGTALVGLLNAFWESKGIISAEAFRKFNSELVPLIRFEKAVYENGETFEAEIEIANFYEDLKDQTLNWKIVNNKGTEIAKGTFDNINLEIGNNRELGIIELPLEVEKAQKFLVSVGLEGTKYDNSWNIWVYPGTGSLESQNVFVTKSYKEAFKALQQGQKVLLNPDYKNLEGIQGRFVPVFWSPVHFPNQPSTMGLLIDEKHAAFNDFPTDWHSDWQWWDLCIQSKSIVIDSVKVTPLIRVIDNFVTNHHLANVFETKVGDGKLVFSSIDLVNKLDERPVARQLRSSLLKYMESEAFNPADGVDFADLDFMNSEAKKEFKDLDIYND